VRVVPRRPGGLRNDVEAVPASNLVTETTQESSGSTPRATIVCRAGDDLGAREDRIDAAVRLGGVAAAPSMSMVKRVGRGQERALRMAKAPTGATAYCACRRLPEC